MSEDSKLAKQYREYEAQLREKAKSFNIRDFDATRVREVFIPELEVVVKFGQLTAGELLEIQKQPPEEQPYHIVHNMLRKAYPDITLEEVKNMDAVAFTLMMNALFKETNFFKMPGASSR